MYFFIGNNNLSSNPLSQLCFCWRNQIERGIMFYGPLNIFFSFDTQLVCGIYIIMGAAYLLKIETIVPLHSRFLRQLVKAAL